MINETNGEIIFDKNIFLFDLLWSGHHPTYFKYFIKYILELGCQVYAFCPDPVGVNKWVNNNVCSNKMFDSFYFSDNEKIFFKTKKFKQYISCIYAVITIIKKN